MNDFTALRHTCYNTTPILHEREKKLAETLFGNTRPPEVDLVLRARALTHQPDPDEIIQLLPSMSAHPLIRRYLVDAIGGSANVKPIATWIGGRLRDPGAHEYISLAGDVGIEAFAVDTLLRWAREDPQTRLHSALQYAAGVDCDVPDSFVIDAIHSDASPCIRFAAWEVLARRHPEEAVALLADTNLPAQPFCANATGSAGLLQSVFYGDPTRPGRGGSGGIGALLLRLGSALSETWEPVVTLAGPLIGGTESDPPIEHIAERHRLVRMPLPLADQAPEAFSYSFTAIRRAYRRSLSMTGIRPRCVHVRFFDDASLAITREAGKNGSKIAATLAPDPHRTLVDGDGHVKKLPADALLWALHRIWIGDEIAATADGWMAIGQDAFSSSLIDYFPQLENVGKRSVAAVDEGVPDPPSCVEIDVEGLLTSASLKHRIDPTAIDRPCLLSVGRLAPVKNQQALVEAWASGIWRSHNLVLIGGDIENPSRQERHIIGMIDRIIAASGIPPGTFAHVAAQSPENIRQIELWAAMRSECVPDLYVAPSLKEEFGLAILEAMGCGMVACAPIAGGVGKYMRSGVNGFLIDTRGAISIRTDLERIIRDFSTSPFLAGYIAQNASRTVARNYSQKMMASEYEKFYRRILQ